MCITVLSSKVFLCKWYCITGFIIFLFTQDFKNWFITLYVLCVQYYILTSVHATLCLPSHHHIVDLLPSGNQYSVLCISVFAFAHLLIFNMNEVIWYLSFSIWFISLSMVPSSSTHVVRNGKILSFLFSHSTSGYSSEEYKNTNLERYTHPYVHCSITYNSQDAETTEVLADG